MGGYCRSTLHMSGGWYTACEKFLAERLGINLTHTWSTDNGQGSFAYAHAPYKYPGSFASGVANCDASADIIGLEHLCSREWHLLI